MLTDPYYEGNTGRTGNLEHTGPHSAENAGLSKQGSHSLHDSGTLILLKVGLEWVPQITEQRGSCDTDKRIKRGKTSETSAVREEGAQFT